GVPIAQKDKYRARGVTGVKSSFSDLAPRASTSVKLRLNPYARAPIAVPSPRIRNCPFRSVWVTFDPSVTIAPARAAPETELCTDPENSEADAIAAIHTRTKTLLAIPRG